MAEEFGLGMRVKDSLTGVDGRVISRTVHLYGVPEVAIQRDGLDADGKMWEPIWLPEARCEYNPDAF